MKENEIASFISSLLPTSNLLQGKMKYNANPISEVKNYIYEAVNLLEGMEIPFQITEYYEKDCDCNVTSMLIKYWYVVKRANMTGMHEFFDEVSKKSFTCPFCSKNWKMNRIIIPRKIIILFDKKLERYSVFFHPRASFRYYPSKILILENIPYDINVYNKNMKEYQGKFISLSEMEYKTYAKSARKKPHKVISIIYEKKDCLPYFDMNVHIPVYDNNNLSINDNAENEDVESGHSTTSSKSRSSKSSNKNKNTSTDSFNKVMNKFHNMFQESSKQTNTYDTQDDENYQDVDSLNYLDQRYQEREKLLKHQNHSNYNTHSQNNNNNSNNNMNMIQNNYLLENNIILIPNLGNTCYVNTMVQILLHTINLNAYNNNNSIENELSANGKDILSIFSLIFHTPKEGVIKFIDYMNQKLPGSPISYSEQGDTFVLMTKFLREIKDKTPKLLSNIEVNWSGTEYKCPVCGTITTDSRAGSLLQIVASSQSSNSSDFVLDFLFPSKSGCQSCSGNKALQGEKKLNKIPKYLIVAIPSPTERSFYVDEKFLVTFGNQPFKVELEAFSIYSDAHYFFVKKIRSNWIAISDNYQYQYTSFNSFGNNKVTSLIYAINPNN